MIKKQTIFSVQPKDPIFRGPISNLASKIHVVANYEILYDQKASFFFSPQPKDPTFRGPRSNLA